MVNVLTLNGSPSASSRTLLILNDVARKLRLEGHQVTHLSVRDLPPEALLHANTNDPELVRAAALVAAADGIVIGTPIYKAAYSGVLKAFLDLLPQFAFDGKTLLPLATGGTVAHVLALDYGLRPVLASLGARHVVPSHFVLDKSVRKNDQSGQLDLEETLAGKLTEAVAAFNDSLRRHSAAPTPLPNLGVLAG
jgi:FMN reductase